MKGDFTRSTFRPQKHFSGVRMQQGRVQLDADWNENLDILLHRIETETLDVIGECGVPIHNAAFGVVTDFTTLSQAEQDWLTAQGWDTLDPGDFYLTRGRAYVDGILVENDQTLLFSQQPFVLPAGDGEIAGPGIYLLYLDVWQRHITALEDPFIREVALGGPDTATRTQVVWQAVLGKVGDVGDTVTCADDLSPWPDASTGKLSARTHPEDDPEDPCAVPPSAGYKRLENQLYRVEIHKASDATGGPTFKWSRDNGSVVVAVSEFSVDGADTKIRTTGLGRDDVLGLHENDWVEILDDATELAGQPGTLLKITKIDPDNILTLSGSVSGYELDGHPKVRRWDSDGETPVSIPVDNDGYLKLEGGVEIKFEINSFQTGDYWLIPARTVPGQYGDIEWPLDSGGDPDALLPFGIVHHYCKLAVITADLVGKDIGITDVDDCRKKFPPLTELPSGGNCCCSVSVGAGGDYPDIQSALAARPQDADEWRICVIEGEHHLNDTVFAEGVSGLVISGCGRQTHIIAPAGKPAFAFARAQDVQIESLWVDAASAQAAILFEFSLSIVVNDCLVTNRVTPEKDGTGETGAALFGTAKNRFGQPGPGIVVKNGKQVEIRDNDVFGLPAILVGGQDISILRNRVTGGGIQLIAPAYMVRIEDNMVFKGLGPGIQLGGGEDDFSGYVETYIPKDGSQPGATGMRAKNLLAGIREVTISRNLIGSMAGSGIVTELSVDRFASLGEVEFLTISDNQIVNCCNTPDVILRGTTGVGGGIVLIGVFSARISQNFIAGNGLTRVPACGVFVLDGSDIDISDNAIVENGVAGDVDNQAQPDSYQAGIAAQFIFGNFIGAGQGDQSVLGYPALRVRGNQVHCPAGQALSVAAMGSIAVDGNTFVSRERLKQPTRPLNFGEKAACVFIFDTGLPVWLPEFALLLRMMLSGQTSLHLESVSEIDGLLAGIPDGRVQFHNNQVTFNTTQVDVVENQGTMNSAWANRIWDATFFSALFISLDDVSLSGNQFQATVPPYAADGLQKYHTGSQEISSGDFLAYLLKFIHVGSSASTVRATGNGLTERLSSNWVSYASNAIAMNTTTSNQATHAFITTAPKKEEANNLSLTS